MEEEGRKVRKGEGEEGGSFIIVLFLFIYILIVLLSSLSLLASSPSLLPLFIPLIRSPFPYLSFPILTFLSPLSYPIFSTSFVFPSLFPYHLCLCLFPHPCHTTLSFLSPPSPSLPPSPPLPSSPSPGKYTTTMDKDGTGTGRNTLQLPLTRADLGATLTCEVKNDAMEQPVTSSVTVFVNGE